jgi:hypothetical protein
VYISIIRAIFYFYFFKHFSIYNNWPSLDTVAILACTSWWDNPPPQKKKIGGMHASKATTQHQHKAVSYHRYTWLSVEPCLAAKQFIQPHLLPLNKTADMADLLEQMWFLLTIEMYKMWQKGTTGR